MTITYLGGTEDTSGVLVSGEYRYTNVIPHASSVVGDLLVIQVHAFSYNALGSDAITLPSGWTLIGRTSESVSTPGSTFKVHCAGYWKIATGVGDLGVSNVVKLGSMFVGGGGASTNHRVKMHTFAGSGGLDGTVITATRAPGSSGVWSAPVPVPTGLALGVMMHGVGANIGAPVTAPWTMDYLGTGNGCHLLSVGPVSPPLPSPSLAPTTAGRAIVAFSITDAIPVVTGDGWRYGRYRIGSGGGFG